MLTLIERPLITFACLLSRWTLYVPTVPDGGTLYFEPHLMFDEAELSELRADVVIAPVVQQSVGPFPLVCGG